MKRRAMVALAMAFLVGVCWFHLQAQQPADAAQASRPAEPAPFAIAHGPYLQLPTATSMTIVWHTTRPGVSRVEYGTTDALGSTAISSRNGLIDNDRTSHVVRLEGLKPATTYHYRVVTREFIGYEKQYIVKYGATATGEVLSFTTLTPTPPAALAAPSASRGAWSFPVVSDIHENAKRLDVMLARVDWRGTPFAVFNGDMVNDFMNVDQPFAGFIDTAVARFARTIPFVYVRGNHDVRGRYARRLAEYFPLSPVGDRAYYSFDHGGVHFIVLDSGEDKVDAHEYYNGLVAFEAYRREQAAWLAEDLRTPTARTARYRIVLSHIPPYEGASAARGTGASSGRAGGGGTGASPAAPQREEGFAITQVRERWEAAANAGRVDLWLSGHTHRYAHVAPVPGKNRYHLVIGAPDTFARVEVSPTQLVVTTTKETGETVETIVIKPRL